MALVTHAVQITCHADVRAAGLLVSTNKARHTARIAGFHDAVRFADREHLADYHPAFAVNPTTEDGADTDSAGLGEDDRRVATVLSDTVGLFVLAGWDATLVADCVEHVASRLGDLSSRPRAVEVLRRDHTAPELLGVPPRSWTALLRIVFGHPAPKHTGTPTGDGVLLRLLSGETLDSLRDDDALTEAIRAAHPDKHAAPGTSTSGARDRERT